MPRIPTDTRISTSPLPSSYSQICRRCFLPLSRCDHSVDERRDSTHASGTIVAAHRDYGNTAAVTEKGLCRICPGNPLQSQCEHTKAGREYLAEPLIARLNSQGRQSLNDDEMIKVLWTMPNIPDPWRYLSDPSKWRPYLSQAPSSQRSAVETRVPPTPGPAIQRPGSSSLASQSSGSQLCAPGLSRHQSLPSNAAIILNVSLDQPQLSTPPASLPRPASHPPVISYLPQPQPSASNPQHRQSPNDIVPVAIMSVDSDDSDASDSERSQSASPDATRASSQPMEIDPAPAVSTTVRLQQSAPPPPVESGINTGRATPPSRNLPTATSDRCGTSSEPAVGSSSQVSKAQKKKKELKHGLVAGAKRGMKEHRVVRKHKQPPPIEDGKAASKRFLESINRLIEKADDLAAATNGWIFIACQHPAAIGSFIHYTSPRLAREAPKQMKEIINPMGELMTHLVHSRRAETLTVLDKLRQAVEERDAGREKEKALEAALLQQQKEKAAMQKMLDQYRERLGLTADLPNS